MATNSVQPDQKADSGDWFFPALIVTVGIVLFGITGIDKYMHRSTANRVSIDDLQYSAPMTDALRRWDGKLPANVSAVHCWFAPPESDSSTGGTWALCEAVLQGRSVKDVGKTSDRWEHFMYERDPQDLVDTKFNFEVQRRNDGLEVLSNVDPQRLSFREASGLVNSLTTVFNDDEQKRLDSAQAAAPDTIKATWPAMASGK
ncbi:hypothetical protein [Burkholderia gladioli]|uniref:Uncharacterized protein n=1 Tax=Burkholderia gladioli (strain BSR3) TaxID=999541 RepID=F2LSB8_BURGS|nr:hypothetical protein [Burkholderia gladioli]AEA65714.1 hypothetical protein bgla_3p0120 [Burkholderia gladioli BSR3]